jgi:hypothetical protein
VPRGTKESELFERIDSAENIYIDQGHWRVTKSDTLPVRGVWLQPCQGQASQGLGQDGCY